MASEISELQKENASMEAHVNKLRHDVSSMEAALKVEQKVSAGGGELVGMVRKTLVVGERGVLSGNGIRRKEMVVSYRQW